MSKLLPLTYAQVIAGSIKFSMMINKTKTKREMEKYLPYFNILMEQISKHNKYSMHEDICNMFWNKYESL